MDCSSASAAERVCDWEEGVQCPNDRNPIFFIQAIYVLPADLRPSPERAYPHRARGLDCPSPSRGATATSADARCKAPDNHLGIGFRCRPLFGFVSVANW